MPNDIGSNNISAKVLPNISVFGVGGAGINAVNNMILSQIDNVKFVALNTDCQSLMNSLAETKIQLGAKCTKGLGAGSNPEIGKQAAEETIENIKRELTDVDMLFIAAGMGGGTGTGASPVIAKMAKDMGILTIAIVIKPFLMEGKKRMQQANSGVEELEKIVDTLIVIENQKLTQLNNINMFDNYAIADGILRQAVYCVISILIKQGFINRDFADIKTVLSSSGRAVIGYGEDIDPKIATDMAIHNPILENSSIRGAKNILVNIIGNKNIKTADAEEIVEKIRKEASINENDEPNVIFGIAFDEELGNNIQVSVIASGVQNTKDEILNNEIKNKNDKTIDMEMSLNEKEKDQITDKNISMEKDKIIDNPVFNKQINEDGLEDDESFNLQVEDIPKIDDNTNLFQDILFSKQKEKKKMNKTIEFEKKREQKTNKKQNEEEDNTIHFSQNGLFDTHKQVKSGSFLSKIISSISPKPEISSTSIFHTQDNNEEDDIYNTPSIKRKIG